MVDAFYWLVNMSITGAIAGLCVLLVRAVPKIPRRVVFLLWTIPLVRFWAPALLVSPYSLISLFLLPDSRFVPVDWEDAELYGMMNITGVADSYFPISFRFWSVYRIFRIASIIWAAVALVILIFLLVSYIQGIRLARRAMPYRDGVFLSDEITSPAVYGILRPRVLIPEGQRDENISYALRHERAHIRRLDNLWRLIALITAAVHWFNPLVWLFLKSFFTDLEQACDETVLRTCTGGERRAYAAALLDQYESRNLLTSAFGGGGLRGRIEKIITYRKLSVFSAICMALLFLALAFVLLTNPA